ncbi:hypothetical protein ES708_00765 [subsurface metagenome]
MWCDYCGARISDGLYQSIVVQLADTEEEKTFYFCCRRCRRAFDRHLTKVVGRVGFDSELSKLDGATPLHTSRRSVQNY